MARGRLSLPYAKAIRLVAYQQGRKSGRVPLNAETLARVEEVAAKYRAKEAQPAIHQAEPKGVTGKTIGTMRRVLRAVRKTRHNAIEPVIIHRRQWDIRSRKKDAADKRAMDARDRLFRVRGLRFNSVPDSAIDQLWRDLNAMAVERQAAS